jgi:hypothetical protein
MKHDEIEAARRSAEERELVLLTLERRIAAYVLYVVTQDIAEWPEDRKCRLSPDEVRDWAEYLADALPESMRPRLPP